MAGHGVAGGHQGTAEAARVRRHDVVFEPRAEGAGEPLPGLAHCHEAGCVVRTSRAREVLHHGDHVGTSHPGG